MAAKQANANVESSDMLNIACDIVAAYVGNNTVKSDDLPALLHEVYTTVTDLSDEKGFVGSNRAPAVPIDKSVTQDHIICLEDGKKLKMLKRYLRTHYDLTPEEYRRKWRLPADYPMTAPSYAKRRSRLAKDIGLGTAATTKRRKKTTRTKGRAR